MDGERGSWQPCPDVDFGELTDDAIAGDWRITQRRRGHRYSLDDVATAWEAARAVPDAQRYADLGCGIGSVLLMVGYKLRPSFAAAIEAQAISHALAEKNLARNGFDARLVRGDMRREDLLDALGGARFDLVTGTPPSLPPGRGSPSTDDQRTYARLEMRGGVEAYLQAAAGVLAEGGRFVVCCGAKTPERAIEGGRAAGLHPRHRRNVVPRAGKKGPLFTVWTFAHEPGALVEAPPLVARDADGARTEASHDLRRFFDLPVNVDEPPSP